MNDVILCRWCGESMHDPEHDVFYKHTRNHTCVPMLRAILKEHDLEYEISRFRIDWINNE